AMWPTAFALTALTAAEEARIIALVTKAVAEDGRGCSGELPGGRSDGQRAGNPARLAPPVRPAAHRLLHGLAVRRRSGARPVGATTTARRGDRPPRSRPVPRPAAGRAGGPASPQPGHLQVPPGGPGRVGRQGAGRPLRRLPQAGQPLAV